ncbi:MAG: NAD(P)-dependent alcohol dehydrogenase [Bacteroidales bacterium]|nr:NAD(P)-dependent alcohol dehydrogenase [Bacteroidales bacterium]
MKIIVYDQYGPPEVLKMAGWDKPEPKENEVLVKVYASAVNPIDWKVRKGLLRMIVNNKFPKTIGADYAGVVEQTGAKHEKFQEGDEVFGMVEYIKGKAYAEYVIARPNEIYHKPESLDFEESAAIPLAALTALQALRDQPKLKKDQHVLITGSAGGVGSFAVQIAKNLGASVTAVCSTEKEDISRQLGADHIIDYKKQEVTDVNERFDIVFDTVAKYPFSKMKKLMKRKSHYVTTLPSASGYIGGLLRKLFSGKKIHTTSVKAVADDLAFLKQLADEGKLKPLIDSKYPLEQAAEAHKRSETGKARGKIILTVQ